SERLALTSTVCGLPLDVVNFVATIAGAVLPRCDVGSSGWVADCARSIANGRFFSNSAWTSASESWKTDPPGPNAAAESTVPATGPPVPPSSSTVNDCVLKFFNASPVMSPLVVYSCAETSGSKPGTAGLAESPTSALFIGASVDGVSTCQPSG